MSIFFLDSSAVVKRYLPEVGTAWIRNLTDPASGHTILVAQITRVEVAAALAARHRASMGISLKERDDAVDLLLQHSDTEYQIIALETSTVSLAVTLTQQYRLRGYDAIQLASVLTVGVALPNLTFIAADNDLVAAAQAEGLAADNPNAHP